MAESLTLLVLVLALVGWIRGFGLQHGAWQSWGPESFAWRGLAQTARLGIPIALQIAFEAWAFSSATFMAGWISREAVGSHQIVLNLATLAFMVPLGISQGAATRVGNLIGAGNMPGVRRAARAALLLGTGIMVIPALAFVLLRSWLPGLYGADPGVIVLAALLLPIAATFQLCDGTQVVAAGVLRGMGRPHVGALCSVLGYYALALPLAYVLGFVFNLGLVGIWVGLAAGLTAVAIASLLLVRVALRVPLAALRVDPVRTPSGYAARPNTVIGAV